MIKLNMCAIIKVHQVHNYDWMDQNCFQRLTQDYFNAIKLKWTFLHEIKKS